MDAVQVQRRTAQNLELSEVTERPLAAYLSMRREWVQSTNMDPDKLLVVKYDSELRPISSDHVLDRIREVPEESGAYFSPTI